MIQSRGVEGRPPKGVQPGISGYRGTRSTPVAVISTSNASSLSAVPTLVDGGRMAEQYTHRRTGRLDALRIAASKTVYVGALS